MLNGFKQQVREAAGEQAEESIERRFHFRRGSDLVAAFKTIHWLIKGYIEAGTLWQIFGAPGSWKTFIALDMAFCLASGKTWQGNLIKNPGRVFYICGEGLNGLARRLKALELHYGIPLENISLFVSSRSASFLDKDGAAEVVTAINDLVVEHGAPDLVIIDTLSRNFGPGDENSTKDMAQFVSIIDLELRDRYQCSVGLVHHSGLTASDRGRGASALRAALDFEYSVTKNHNDSRTMKCTKCKDFEAPPEISFRSEEIELPWVDEDSGYPLSSLVLIETNDTGNKESKKGKVKHKVKVALETFNELVKTAGTAPKKAIQKKIVASNKLYTPSDKVISCEKWRKECYRAGISSGDQPAKAKAFREAHDELLSGGFIGCYDDYYWKIAK